MTQSDPGPHHAAATGHGSTATAADHAAGGHGSSHDAHDDAESLGPVDLGMWGAGVLAAAIGLLVTLCYVLATSGSGAY